MLYPLSYEGVERAIVAVGLEALRMGPLTLA